MVIVRVRRLGLSRLQVCCFLSGGGRHTSRVYLHEEEQKQEPGEAHLFGFRLSLGGHFLQFVCLVHHKSALIVFLGRPKSEMVRVRRQSSTHCNLLR